jgi:PhnB protein
MSLKPQLSLMFNGQCEAAFTFYAQHLNATIVGVARYAGSPMAGSVPPEWGDKVMHGSIAVGDTIIAGADVHSLHYRQPRGFSVLLGVAIPEDADRIFQALADGGTVTVPLQETFWSARYGAVTDQFGVPWEINCAQQPTQDRGSS